MTSTAGPATQNFSSAEDPLSIAAAQRREVELRLEALRRHHKRDQAAQMEATDGGQLFTQTTSSRVIVEPKGSFNPDSAGYSASSKAETEGPSTWEAATSTAQNVATQTVETVKAVASAAASAVYNVTASSEPPSTADLIEEKYEEGRKLRRSDPEVSSGFLPRRPAKPRRSEDSVPFAEGFEASAPASPKVFHSLTAEQHIAASPAAPQSLAATGPPVSAFAAAHNQADFDEDRDEITAERIDAVQASGRNPVTARPISAPRTPHKAEAAPAAPAAPRRQIGRNGANGVTEDWLSKLIEHFWPKIRSVTEEIAWETVPPNLNDSRPSWVHSLDLKKFVLGDTEPDLLDVRCYKDEEDIMDDVFIEMDLEWRSQQDVELALEVLGKDVSAWVPNLIEEQLAKLFTLVVGVEDSYVKGTLQLALRPLYYRMPIVGAVQVSFVKMPEFEFTPTVAGGPLGSALNALLPAVKAWLKTTVNEALWMPYVLPEHYFYPLEDGAPDVQRPLGVLHCRIIEAQNVPRMDLFGWSDTFVEAYVRHTQRNTTKIVKGKNPQWKDEVMIMPVHSIEYQHLRFALWDYDPISPNDEIGRCDVAIKEIPEGEAKELWLDVVNEGEEQQQAAKHGEEGIQYRKRDRALRAVTKPVTGHSTAKTSLHVRVHWRRWSDDETKFIQNAQRVGVRKVLTSPEGRKIDQGLRELLWSGSVHVLVQHCKGLNVQGLLWRPSVKIVVTVGDLDPAETPPFKVSRRNGSAELANVPVQVNVPGKIAEKEELQVRIDFQEVGLLSGNDIVGSLSIPLSELMDKGCIHGQKHLNGNGKKGRGPSAKMEVRWVGTFA